MDIGKVCDAGGRRVNEDKILAVEASGSLGCFAVADGLGGHSGGDLAAEIVLGEIERGFRASPETGVARLKSLIESAHGVLTEKAEADAAHKRMRTTLAVLVTDGKKAVWAHIGDSRIYRFKDGKMESVTADHSVAYLAYKNDEISYDEIRRSPDQNRLLRSLGAETEPRAEFGEAEIESGDAFLLCSDGFWELIDENEMEKTLKKSKTASRWIAKMVRQLKKNAPDGEYDNYSAITVMI